MAHVNRKKVWFWSLLSKQPGRKRGGSIDGMGANCGSHPLIHTFDRTQSGTRYGLISTCRKKPPTDQSSNQGQWGRRKKWVRAALRGGKEKPSLAYSAPVSGGFFIGIGFAIVNPWMSMVTALFVPPVQPPSAILDWFGRWGFSFSTLHAPYLFDIYMFKMVAYVTIFGLSPRNNSEALS